MILDLRREDKTKGGKFIEDCFRNVLRSVLQCGLNQVQSAADEFDPSISAADEFDPSISAGIDSLVHLAHFNPS